MITTTSNKSNIEFCFAETTDVYELRQGYDTEGEAGNSGPPPSRPGRPGPPGPPPPTQAYKVKFGQEIYYCKPYQPFHTQLRYNFSGEKTEYCSVQIFSNDCFTFHMKRFALELQGSNKNIRNELHLFQSC